MANETVTTPTAPLTTAADWAGAFSELPTLPEDAADAFLAKTYAICDSGSWRTAMIGFLTTYAAQVRRAQWQDIATHPKDHFPCLVCHKDRGRMVAFIDVTGAWWPVPAHERLDFEPTHWMPLPERPGSPSSQTDTALEGQ